MRHLDETAEALHLRPLVWRTAGAGRNAEMHGIPVPLTLPTAGTCGAEH